MRHPHHHGASCSASQVTEAPNLTLAPRSLSASEAFLVWKVAELLGEALASLSPDPQSPGTSSAASRPPAPVQRLGIKADAAARLAGAMAEALVASLARQGAVSAEMRARDMASAVFAAPAAATLARGLRTLLALSAPATVRALAHADVLPSLAEGALTDGPVGTHCRALLAPLLRQTGPKVLSESLRKRLRSGTLAVLERVAR